MQRILNYIVIVLLGFSFSYDNGIKDIPIQASGRIKPLDTFARDQLLSFYGKTKLKHEALSAINLLEALVLDVDSVAYKDIFNINNPEIVHTLGLDWENNYHKYNFIEIFTGINNEIDYFNSLKSKKEEDLTKKEIDFKNIYSSAYYFIELNASLRQAYLLPEIEIENEYIANQLGLEKGKLISFHYFYYNKESFLNLFKEILTSEKLSNQNIENLNDEELSAFSLAHRLHTLESSYHDYLQGYLKQNPIQILKIIPPDPYIEGAPWFSPLEILAERNGSPTDRQIKLLLSLEAYISNRINSNQIKADSAIINYKEIISDITTDVNQKLLEREIWYNKVDLLYYSLAFYILSFLLICISWVFKPNITYNIALSSILMGILIHLYTIINRMIIMQRPPVSTLYESIIFVGFITVFFSIIIEFWRKNSSGVFIGSIMGTFLLFISLGYASDGDTMGVLVAVLNSNFWLATHVVTITIGYGVTVVASMLAHLYLIKAIANPVNKEQLKKVHDSLLGITIFALFFTLFGTILGGIWADQSWGRFWGWDPKENGALLIVLWLIIMLHLRITSFIKPIGFAIGMILANITVALAWFGVNLLGVGLHSYGFTDNVAMNLIMFIIFELSFAFISYYVYKYRIRVNR